MDRDFRGLQFTGLQRVGHDWATNILSSLSFNVLDIVDLLVLNSQQQYEAGLSEAYQTQVFSV